MKEHRPFFLRVYSDFNDWLKDIGFRVADYNESSISLNYHYSHFSKHIDSHGVEHYIHDILDESILFLRDNNEHKIMFVGYMGTHSKVYSLDQAKALITDILKKKKYYYLTKLYSLSL